MELLTELNKEGTTIVMVTHSQHDSGYAGRTINLFDGQVVNEIKYESIYYRGGLTTSIITKGYYNNERLLKHQTYCPQLVAKQTFFLISLFSLTAGLGCTNLLMTFLSMNIMWKNIIPTVTSFIYYVKTLQWKKVLK